MRNGNLTVIVNGFNHERGVVIANLFRPGDAVMKMKSAHVKARAPILNLAAQVIFADIPYGEYAVSVFHDEDLKGEVTHRLGLPMEPLGFSNGFVPGILTGPPTFDRLRFVFQPDVSEIHISVRRILAGLRK